MKFNIFVLSIIGSSNGEHLSRRLRKFSNEQPSAAKNLEQQRTLTDDSSMSVEQVSYLGEQYSLSMEFGRGGGSSGRGFGGGGSSTSGKGKECSRKDQQIGAFLPTNGNVGIMFKIEAKEDLIIDGFSYLPDPDLFQSTSSYDDTVTIFTKCGDYVGDESNEDKWDKVSTSQVSCIQRSLHPLGIGTMVLFCGSYACETLHQRLYGRIKLFVHTIWICFALSLNNWLYYCQLISQLLLCP